MAITDVNSTICITTGEPGAGKTLSRGVMYTVEVYLLDKVGIMYHNCPLNHDIIIDNIVEKYKKDRTEIQNRLVFIPTSETDKWKTECFFNYFIDKNLENSYVLIDEAHVFFGKSILSAGNRELKYDTEKALSEFRHNGARLELMTQSYMAIDKSVRDRCGYSISIINFQDYNDVVFGIKMRDWFQLKAKLMGYYTSATLQVEHKVSEDKLKRIGTKIWWHKSEYYKMFNSHNGGEGSIGANTANLKDTWQLKSWPSLVYWFLRRNLINLFIGTKISIVSWCLLLFIFFGPKDLIISWVKAVESRIVKPTNKTNNNSTNKNKSNEKVENIEPEIVKALKLQNEELQNKVKEFEMIDKANQLKVKTDKTITLLDEEGILLYDGSYFKIGSVIDYGYLEGKRIEKIDVKQNRILFEGGIIINIGSSLYEKTEFGISRVSESLQNESAENRKTGNPKYSEIGEISNRGSRSSTVSELSSQ